MELLDKGTDGYVRNDAYTWSNKFNNELVTAVAAHWGITAGSANNWKVNNYKIQVIEGCCDKDMEKSSWSSSYRGRSKTKIGDHSGSYGWHSRIKETSQVTEYFIIKMHLVQDLETKAREHCESKGHKFATLKDIDENTVWSGGQLSGEKTGYYRNGKWNPCCHGGYGGLSVFCRFWNVSETPDNAFVVAKWNFSEEKKKELFIQ